MLQAGRIYKAYFFQLYRGRIFTRTILPATSTSTAARMYLPKRSKFNHWPIIFCLFNGNYSPFDKAEQSKRQAAWSGGFVNRA